ncbi:MAG: YfhO family protein [Eubacterium sp.]|nr:YfhO family protein [Eubacterium sp.]
MINKFNKQNNIVKYSIFFVIGFIASFYVFLVYKKSFAWHVDGYDQHVLALTYYGQWLRQIARSIFIDHTFSFQMWNFSIGYGGDVLATLNYYVIGEPITLLTAIVPAKYTEYLYFLLTVIRFYLSGLFFMYYCKERGIVGNKVVIGSIIYAFNVFAIFGSVRHPFFLIPMVFLPLILAGVEKIINKKKPYLFIASVAIAAISNFYFFYMLVIVTVVYVLVRLIYIYKKDIKNIILNVFKILSCSVVGLMISCVLLLPTIILFLGDTRKDVDLNIPFLYEFSYYQKLLSTFISSSTSLYWTFLGLSPIVLIAIYFVFKKRDSQKISLYIISFIILIFPFLGSVMNGFSYYSNRWIWAFVFLCAFSICKYWDDIVSIKLFEHKRLLILLAIYTGLLLIMHNTRTPNVLIILLLFFIAIFSVSYINDSKQGLFKYRALIIIATIFIGFGINTYYRFDVSQGKYILEFMDCGSLNKAYKSTDAYDIKKNINDNSFYRYSSTNDEYSNESDKTKKVNRIFSGQYNFGMLSGSNRLDNASNASMLFDNNNVGFYWSLGNNNTNDYLENVENKEYRSCYYYGVDGRPGLCSLSSVKYFIAEKTETDKVPYGFKYSKTFKKKTPNGLRYKGVNELNKKAYKTKYNIFKNEYALPFGYTYDSTVSENEVSKLNGVQKENLMLDSAIVEDKDLLSSNKANINTNSEKLKYTVISNDAVVKKHSILAKRDGRSVTLKFDNVKDCSLYVGIKNLRIKQFNVVDANKNIYDSLSYTDKKIMDNAIIDYADLECTKFNFSCNSVNKLLMYYNYGSIVNNRKDFVVNMCYSKLNRNAITITFDKKGLYEFDDLYVIKQSMNDYGKSINKLKENVFEDVKITNNHISGNINLNKKKLLCLNIPYTDGWKLKVDGKDKDLIKVNYMNSGVILEPGKHHIELSYFTPGLKIGLVLSGVGILIFVVIIVFGISRKKKRK